MLCLIDEFAREALAIRVKRKLNSTDVPETPADLMICRETPTFTRSDNGPEFIAQTLQDWIAAVGTQTAYIEPGRAVRPGSRQSVDPRRQLHLARLNL
jgi:putative transposase